MPKIHVLLKKEELDGVRLPGKIVIVLDVLFATSTIVTALANGALEVIPALDETAAKTAASAMPAGSFVIAGELNAITIEGFAVPTPHALLNAGIEGDEPRNFAQASRTSKHKATEIAQGSRVVIDRAQQRCGGETCPGLPWSSPVRPSG